MKPWYLLLCGLNGAFERLQQLPILNLPPKPNDMNAKTQGGIPTTSWCINLVGHVVLG
jgi:hypothetical protein